VRPSLFKRGAGGEFVSKPEKRNLQNLINPGGFAYYLILSKKIRILFHTVSLSLLFLFFMEEI